MFVVFPGFSFTVKNEHVESNIKLTNCDDENMATSCCHSKYLICPINSNHKVNSKRYDDHLLRCRLMNLEKLDTTSQNESEISIYSNYEDRSSSLIGEQNDHSDLTHQSSFTINHDLKSGEPTISIDWKRLEQVDRFQYIPYNILMMMTIDQRKRYKDCLFNYTKQHYLY